MTSIGQINKLSPTHPGGVRLASKAVRQVKVRSEQDIAQRLETIFQGANQLLIQNKPDKALEVLSPLINNPKANPNLRLRAISMFAEYFMQSVSSTERKVNVNKALFKLILSGMVKKAQKIDSTSPVTLLVAIRHDLLKHIHGFDKSISNWWKGADKTETLQDLELRIMDLQNHEQYTISTTFQQYLDSTMQALIQHAKEHKIGLHGFSTRITHHK